MNGNLLENRLLIIKLLKICQKLKNIADSTPPPIQ